MTAATETLLKGAVCIDFTGRVPGFLHFTAVDQRFTETIRKGGPGKTFVMFDEAVGDLDAPVVVRDHLNLTGTNPLIGPNHECGERFPVVQGIYVEDALSELPRAVVAGLKAGIQPDAQDWKIIHDLGAELASYNVVPAMLLIAHARCRVLAIIVPKGTTPPDALVAKIRRLVGETK